MFKQRRINQTVTLKERLTAWADGMRHQAAQLPPGPDREALLRKAGQAETAFHLYDWVNSSGLQPPK